MMQHYRFHQVSRKTFQAFLKASYATEANLQAAATKLHRLDAGPKTEVAFTQDLAKTLYRQMTVVRRIEGTLANLYKSKLVRGFCHLYSGQEAIAIGIKARMTGKDNIITSYRCHGWTYIMGISPLGVIAELMGREAGCARGRGGSMHLYTDNFYGGNGIVGAQVPLGTGLALKHKLANTGGFNVCLYGDGAANQGQVAESHNIAKLLNLPIMYVVENNLYGMGTPVQRSSANTEYYTRGDHIPGILTDGMDLPSVIAATDYAREHIMGGKGPIIVEMSTYRYFGHSMSDPGTSYRTREEVKHVRETRDPINAFKKKVVEAQLLTEDDIHKIDDEAKKEVADAENKAKKDKEIPMKDLFTDVYAVNYEQQIRNTVVDMPGQHIRFGDAVNLK